MTMRYPTAFAAALVAAAAVTLNAAPSGTLLVADKDDQSLSIVDLGSGKEVARIAEEGFTGHEVAASPDGRLAFVPIYGNAGVGQSGTDGSLIRVIDLGKRAIVSTIDFGKGVRPHCPVFGPDGLLYVTTELEQAVTVIDPKTFAIVGSIPTGHPESHMLVISHDGRRGYTANVKSGTVSVLDLRARSLIATIPVAAVTQRISISADDRWVFTADQTKLRIAVIDTAKNAVAASVPLPGIGFGTTASPDGRWLLATLPRLDRVAIIDLTTLRVARTVEVPKSPQEIRVSADSRFAYVSCNVAKKVAVIDLVAGTVSELIEVGANDDGLALIAAE